jgi:hypothetical protein
VQNEGRGVNPREGIGIEMTGVKGQGEAILPRFLANSSGEGAVDVRSKLSMEAVGGVEDKVGVGGPCSAGWFLHSRVKREDAIRRSMVSWGGGDVVRNINVELGCVRCFAVSRTRSAERENLRVRESREDHN